MTAEIAILNRQGVALAADSALTVGKKRVWKTANKLFSLGPAHDIGIMMHGSADYLGYPWETIIKLFRHRVQGTSYPTVLDCAGDFNEFVLSEQFRDPIQETFSIAQFLLATLERAAEHLAEFGLNASRTEKRRIVTEYFDGLLAALNSDEAPKPFNTVYTIANFNRHWSGFLDEAIQNTLPGLVTRRARRSLVPALHQILTREVESDLSTGIVIAGFGDDELYPAIHSYTYDGRRDDFSRAWLHLSRDLNKKNVTATVLPFGQADVVYNVMEGVSMPNLQFAVDTLGEILSRRSEEIIAHYITDEDERLVERRLQEKENETLLEQFEAEFQAFRKETSTDPVVEAIGSLPREEMAEMARALVDITSLRRRMDSTLESVGGPVDVAIISKGDGFIWMNRKHYFDIALNRDFLYRKHGARRSENADEIQD